MQPEKTPPSNDDIDLVTLGSAVWRAKWWIVGLALAAGFITYVALTMMRPVYTSEARILIENQESIYRRPSGEQISTTASSLDEQAIQSQVQVLSSRDLAIEVVKELDLVNNPEFAQDTGAGFIGSLLAKISMQSEKSKVEQAAVAFSDHLLVYQLDKSSVIAVDYTSGDPGLAAEAANSLARAYIEWQREAKLAQTRDATAWLRSQIAALREQVAKSESAVEDFRAKEGIYSGSGDVDLTSQQLSELNSKLILAKAEKSEAEARARMIRKMLADNGDIEATSEVLKSQLNSRLIEQRVQVQRQLAELSATLLPSHPRIQQLQSELADVRRQIRDEARKVAQSLENEAQVADARVQSLTSSLKAAKSQASGEGAAEIKLRALEREAKSNRDLLEAYLARYRDASARGDVGAVPANATIVSQAYASTSPSFPKKLPITLLVMVAVTLLVLAYVLARELINATSVAGVPVRTSRTRYGEPAEAEDTSWQEDKSKPKDPPTQTPEPDLSETDADAESSAAAQPRSIKDVIARNSQRADAHREALEAEARRHPFAGQPVQRAQDDEGEGGAASDDLTDESDATNDVKAADALEPPVAAPALFNYSPSETGSAGSERVSPLDQYLRQRRSRPPIEKAAETVLTSAAPRRAAPILRNMDLMSDELAARLGSKGAGAALITPVSASNALPEAIELSRELTAKGKSVLLLDIAQGASSVSDFLELKRAPGFNELLANAAAFEDVIRVDSKTPLQVITAGSANLSPPPNELESFSRIFQALSLTYDYVVIHSDFERTKRYAPTLQTKLSVVVALFAAETVSDEENQLSALSSLDCPFILYERSISSAKETRENSRNRAAAS